MSLIASYLLTISTSAPDYSIPVMLLVDVMSLLTLSLLISLSHNMGPT